MTINARSKGQRGEREIVHLLNGIIERVLTTQPWPEDVVSIARSCIQRNQNQSAVGGQDLSGVFDLSIEVKRVEVLQVDKWWEQCTRQALRNAEHPVLLYRQNERRWTARTLGNAPLPGSRTLGLPIALDQDSFETWFFSWVYYKMAAGEMPRV